jgi:hypothetical protein
VSAPSFPLRPLAVIAGFHPPACGEIRRFSPIGKRAKPMLVTLPFVPLLLDYWPLRRMEWKEPSREPQESPSQIGDMATAPVPPVAHTVLPWALVRLLLVEKVPPFCSHRAVERCHGLTSRTRGRGRNYRSPSAKRAARECLRFLCGLHC